MIPFYQNKFRLIVIVQFLQFNNEITDIASNVRDS